MNGNLDWDALARATAEELRPEFHVGPEGTVYRIVWNTNPVEQREQDYGWLEPVDEDDA